MRHRLVFVAGVFLLLVGCLAGVGLALLALNAYVKGAFSTIVTETPATSCEAIHCPLILNQSEAGRFSVILRNPSSQILQYTLYFLPAGIPGPEAPPPLRASLAPGQSETFHWSTSAREVGGQGIAVQATSDSDAALPGPFHLWPTSFRSSCGFLVVPGPLTGTQLVLLICTVTLLGLLATVPWAIERFRTSKKVTSSAIAP